MYPWPPSKDTISDYVTWSFTVKKLKSTTVILYLSSLKCIHSLRSLSTENFDSSLVSTLIRGGENLEIYNEKTKEKRKVMSLPLLKILGHKISKTDWPSNSKQALWTACTTAFFGSFCLGEILPATEKLSHPSDTLLWKDVKILSDDHVLIHIKVNKSR